MSGPITRDGALVGWSNANYRLETMPPREANALIIAHHYSKRVATGHTYIHLGLRRVGSEEVVGVLQFGYALNPASGGRLVEGTGNREWCELNRMWVADTEPRNTETQALSLAMRYLRRAYPALGFVQSFADERCGGLGVVYQAANFTYHGAHKSLFYELDGEWYHKNIMSPKATKNGPRSLNFRANVHRATRHHLRQFRYIYWLRPRLRELCKLPELPYPKRVAPAAVVG